MLKLTYTEAGLHLERVTQPLEAWVACRVILAVRLGQSLYLETGRAAFLLPADVPELPTLCTLIRQEPGNAIALDEIGLDLVEVSLKGTWMAADTQAHEGTFIVMVSDRLEVLLSMLWQKTQTHVSFLL